MKHAFPLPLVLLVLACGDADRGAAAGPPLAAEHWLPAAPAEALDVLEARGLEDGATVAVAGRVGEYVPARAQFSLVDRSFTSCDQRPGDSCSTPWDYCCVPPDELARGTVNVEFRADGVLRKASLAGQHGFQHLADVVVVGRLAKDDAGNVTVLADGLHVRG